MTAAAMPSGLYDGAGNPLLGSPAVNTADLFRGRPVCRLLFDTAKNPQWSGGDVERQWALPRGANPLPTAANVLADLVAVLDRGDRVAILATHDAAADAATAAVLALAGGGRA